MDHLPVKAGPDHQEKAAAIYAADMETTGYASRDDTRDRLGATWQTEFEGEHVCGSHGDDPDRDIRADDARDDLVDGAVAPGRDDGIHTLGDGFRGDMRGIARAGRADHGDLKAPSDEGGYRVM